MIFSDILFQNIMAKKGSFLMIIGLEIYHFLHSSPSFGKVYIYHTMKNTSTMKILMQIVAFSHSQF